MILNVIALSKEYKCRPSELMDITDAYTAYCFDEACTYIKAMIDKGIEPIFKKKYSSFSEMYKDL